MRKAEMRRIIKKAVKQVERKYVERDKLLRKSPDFKNRFGGLVTEILETIQGLGIEVVPGQLEEVIAETMLAWGDIMVDHKS